MTLLNIRYVCYAALTVIAVAQSEYSRGQLLYPDVPEHNYLITAGDESNNESYGLSAQGAREYLKAAQQHVVLGEGVGADEAHYYMALAGIMQNTPGGVDSAIEYLSGTSDIIFRERIAFAIAQYFFRHEDLADAIPYYEGTGISNLTNTEIVDEKFELAYCYFNNRNFNKAEPLFASIKEVTDGKYYLAGNYYYGLLAYNENNYKEALRSFGRIKDSRIYSNIVPYYIAEIYYFMGERKKAMDYALTLLRRREKLFYDNELHLLVAQCLFEDDRYSDALPYFEQYYTGADKIRKEDIYEIAYCYYRVNDWAHAVDKFKQLSSTQDSLGQTAMYLLGDCYLKTGDKQSAHNAFSICADLPFNQGQQEASMMLDARLSAELGYYDEAVHALHQLLVSFPHTTYYDEAQTLLSDLCIRGSRYYDAIAHLGEVKHKDAEYKRVYQKVTYGYAIQQFAGGNIADADSFLTLSLEYPENETYEAAALFWKGETSYRLKRYADVLKYDGEFLESKGLPSGRSYSKLALLRLSPGATTQHASMNMGYAAMHLQDYDKAQQYFSAAEQQGEDASLTGIAGLREADALLMQKNYAKALALYDKASATPGKDANYARYQKAIILGLLGKQADEISQLQYLAAERPVNEYTLQGYYELGNVNIERGLYLQAAARFAALADSFPANDLASKSLLKLGFIYQQLNYNDSAITAYTRVITEYPNSAERPAALDALKSLYIQTNQPGAYRDFLRDNDLPSPDSASLDSAYYMAGENQYASGNWQPAVQTFTTYLAQYPQGVFTLKAQYYRAESNYQLHNDTAALQDYDSVLATSWNDYSFNSALRAGKINYDQHEYPSATADYLLAKAHAQDNSSFAESYEGLMKSNFYAGRFADAYGYADSLRNLAAIPENTLAEASLYQAKSLQEQKRYDDAIKMYDSLIAGKNGATSAEAGYRIAQISLLQDKLKEAEQLANDAIKNANGYDYWIVSSYILLSDILVKEKDFFNAKATLQSILKNSNIPDLKKTATEKLEEVKKLEKKHSKLSEE
jgi:tetratricopeptide (TPR) repeat protein